MYFNFKGFRKPRRYSMDENGWFSCRIQTKSQWSRCWTCSPVHLTMQMLNIKILNQILFYRAHLNDLENILPYLFAGFFYVLTNPTVATAQLNCSKWQQSLVLFTQLFIQSLLFHNQQEDWRSLFIMLSRFIWPFQFCFMTELDKKKSVFRIEIQKTKL